MVESLTTAGLRNLCGDGGARFGHSGQFAAVHVPDRRCRCVTVPAWQAVVPQLVPKDDLPAAVAANSVGVNISRALGPALGGATISGFGIVAPFWINAIANLGIVGALLWWRQARGPARSCRRSVSGRPSGPVFAMPGIIRICAARSCGRQVFSCSPAPIGRCCRSSHAPDRKRARTLRCAARRHRCRRRGRRFFPAMAEAKARTEPADGRGRAGSGGRDGPLWLGARPGHGACRQRGCGGVMDRSAGDAHCSAQVALPDWVRGRGLALYTTVFFGCLTLGSAVWGELAAVLGLPVAHFSLPPARLRPFL